LAGADVLAITKYMPGKKLLFKSTVNVLSVVAPIAGVKCKVSELVLVEVTELRFMANATALASATN
jgi:histidinol dehydrogenase